MCSPREQQRQNWEGIPLHVLIIDNLETLLAITVDKACGNISGSMVEMFIKHRASTISGHPVYSPDGPGPSMVVLGPHEEFPNGAFQIWVGGKHS